MVRNIRDVGAEANRLSAKALMRTGRLSRSGTIDTTEDLASVGNPKTIVCLRSQAGDFEDAARCIHVQAYNRVENYQTERKKVRKWVNHALGVLEGDIKLTVLYHGTAGKYTTGVVISALLKLLGIPEEIFWKEFALSEEGWRFRCGNQQMRDPGRLAVPE